MKKLSRRASEIFKRMGLVQYPDGWYVTGVPQYYVDGMLYGDYGPYKNKKEAVSDMMGVAKTLSELEE